MHEGIERSRPSLKDALKAAYRNAVTLDGRLDDFPATQIPERMTRSLASGAAEVGAAAAPVALAGTLFATAPGSALAAGNAPRVETVHTQTGALALDTLMQDVVRAGHPLEHDATTLSPLDIACLARNAFNEARGEGFEGQLGTILVALARVKSKRFAHSVCGVVYQPYQFSWTHDERILLAQAQNERKIDPIFAKLDALLGGQKIDEAIALLASLLKLPPNTLYYKRTDWDENKPEDAKKKGMSERAMRMWRSLKNVGIIGNHTFYTDPPR